MQLKRRKLAFYKKDKSEWTLEEFNNIMQYVGDDTTKIDDWIYYYDEKDKNMPYIFDNGDSELFMHFWLNQENDPNFKNCTKIAYEDVFVFETKSVEE